MDRAGVLLDRRGGGRTRLVYVVDNIGAYVAQSTRRVQQLLALGEAFTRSRGQIWLVVTSLPHTEYGAVRSELWKVSDRFPIKVDLFDSNTLEVICERLLKKSPDGAAALRRLIAPHVHVLTKNLRIDSAVYGHRPTEDELVQTYPLVPYQLQLMMDVIEAKRAAAPEQALGFHRTAIQVVRQLVIGVQENRVGDLITLDAVYELIYPIVSEDWRAEIDSVVRAYGRGGIESRICKVLAVGAGVPGLSLTAQNVADLLHPAIDAQSIFTQVNHALDRLVGDGRIVSCDKDNDFALAPSR